MLTIKNLTAVWSLNVINLPSPVALYYNSEWEVYSVEDLYDGY